MNFSSAVCFLIPTFWSLQILLQALLIAWACKSPTDRDTDIEVEEVLDASQVHLMPEEIMEYMPKMGWSGCDVLRSSRKQPPNARNFHVKWACCL